jgi:uncharacterized protein
MLKLLVIQTTPFCNIDCNYCYLPSKENKKIFDATLIPHIMEKLQTMPLYDGELHVAWHAGEPLVVKPSFYRNIFEQIEKYNTKKFPIRHNIQTNAMLITQEYCELFKEYQMSIGVSIDGPDYVHDFHRKTRKGKGTHKEVLRGIELLNKNNIQFSVIAVISQHSLPYANEIMEHFESIGVRRVGFNIEEIEGMNTKSSLSHASNMMEAYKQFMQQVYIKSKQLGIVVREFEATEKVIKYGQNSIFNTNNVPFAIINIDIDGNFSTFSPELLGIKDKKYGDFVIGNVKDTPFSIVGNEKLQLFIRDINKGIQECKVSCEYFGVCGGGMPSNKLQENGTFASSATLHCQYTTKLLADLALENLELALL